MPIVRHDDFGLELRDNEELKWSGGPCFDCGRHCSTDGCGPGGGMFDQMSGAARQLLNRMRERSHNVFSTQGRSLVVKALTTESADQSDDFLLLELLSDFDDLSLDLLAESDLLDDSLAFLSAAASLL